MMKALEGFFNGVLKGLVEVTLIPSLKRALKKLDKSEAKKWLDVNNDGIVDWNDVRALQWEQIGKLLAIVLILWGAVKLGVIDAILKLLRAF